MTNKGWEKVETIFHSALELKAEEREAYLQSECADDLKLREDVESLLDSFENKADFLDKPVFELGLGAIGAAGQKNLAGQEIGVYRIEEKIGAGGMGEVYRAIDTKLNRLVALKFLPQSMENDRAARRRLVKEAQAAAALSHQNICAVHSVEESDEQTFIVMQFIEGETLDKSLNGTEISVEEFKFLARQIVTAVAFAHSHGVIHRDLKPGNIMLTEDGEIKILDFGLAKVMPQAASMNGKSNADTNFSQNGLVIGTVAYMSPEQLRGEKLDYRTDIFSVGIILYEILAKKNPFNRQSQAETISAILSEKAAPLVEFAPEFPTNLVHLVEKCLEKDANNRFQSAAEILVELDNAENKNFVEIKAIRRNRILLRVALATALILAIFAGLFLYNSRYSRRTLAVLPISIEQSLIEKEYLADGLTQGIIEKLSKLSELSVKNEAIVSRYKGKEPLVAGKELNVDAVFVGLIKNRADGLVLESKIIRVSDGVLLASPDEVKIEESNLIGLPENIAARIIDKVQTKLTYKEGNQLIKKDTESAEAKNLYLQGRYFLKKRQSEHVEKAIKCFFDAKEIDQKYAKAWAGLADAYLALSGTGVKGSITPEESVKSARLAANKALELDNTLSESYNSLGLIGLKYDWKWAESETYYKLAIERDKEFLNPRFGLINLFRLQKRFDEALQQINEVKEIDPFSIRADIELALISYNKNDYEAADKILSSLLTKYPDDVGVKYVRSYQLLKMQRFKEATEILEPFYQSNKEDDKIFVAAPLGFAYAKMGKRADALKIIEDLDKFRKNGFVPAQEKSLIYVALGDYDKVFEFLNRSCEEKFSSLPGWISDPIVEEVWSDPRFATIKECTKL